MRVAQLRTGRRTSISGEATCTVSRDRGYDPCRRHHANYEVGVIADVDITGRIDRNGVGIVQLRAGGWSVVAGVTRSAIAGNRRDSAT